MLLPYVFVEWPAGIIADRWLGEKELLIAGFVVTAVPTFLLFFFHSPNIILWGGVLFVTRIGTALIESMTETYFFKHVDGRDTHLISFFRMLRPLAYVIGPLVATLVLAFLPLPYLWLVLGTIMLLGIFHASRLVDTR
jgi:MFS family permease